jgi:hypothetical protein
MESFFSSCVGRSTNSHAAMPQPHLVLPLYPNLAPKLNPRRRSSSLPQPWPPTSNLPAPWPLSSRSSWTCCMAQAGGAQVELVIPCADGFCAPTKWEGDHCKYRRPPPHRRTKGVRWPPEMEEECLACAQRRGFNPRWPGLRLLPLSSGPPTA